MEEKKFYAVAPRPGYFGNNQATVYSAHTTLQAARKALGKTESACIVSRIGNPFRKGQTLWGDMYPHVEE